MTVSQSDFFVYLVACKISLMGSQEVVGNVGGKYTGTKVHLHPRENSDNKKIDL